METKLKSGDVVTFKSGGHKMTVDVVVIDPDINEYKVYLVWFLETERQPQRAVFYERVLEKITTDE